MNYLMFKVIVGDEPGAKVFQKLAPLWNSIKKLDDQYMGQEHYWGFYQLGDFDFVEMTIVKWEIWSTWRMKAPFDDFNKGAYVGVTCGVLIYNPDDPKSFAQLQTILKFYQEKRRSNLAPVVVVALLDQPGREIPEDQRIYIETSNCRILRFTTPDFEADLQKRLDGIYSLLLEELQPELCKRININKNWWYLPLDELRAILIAERKGIRLRPRKAPPLPKPEPAPAAAPAAPAAEAPKMKASDLTEDELKYFAIGPQGEAVKIEPTITQEEIIDLVKKGFKLPPWVVIPRHCPKCYNQNQHSIREVVDKSIVLMQNPPIYGLKLVCGNCGNTWHP